jgi:hypothetical protein
MKRDQNYISRLEPGDTFKNSRGETCIVTKIDKYGNIDAATKDYPSYYRPYDKNGSGSPSSGDIETP